MLFVLTEYEIRVRVRRARVGTRARRESVATRACAWRDGCAARRVPVHGGGRLASAAAGTHVLPARGTSRTGPRRSPGVAPRRAATYLRV
ncbi:hypothetical protein K1T71_010162 [Dendrolimus kikuchii]|uniref:Uncharacterized protein n=1 Tax=Dendrolimus kikuchii TaxID=765133 RepID=A0ACC1CQV2_9NEOP|nr:hypothetical protein K1T71_010162 [Dendrolimus kikuchii]